MRNALPLKLSVAAFATSLLFSFSVFPIISQVQNINIDVDRFGLVAQNISTGNGFVYEASGDPVLERTPLYPLLLVGVFSISGGYSAAAVQIFQALLHAITGFIVYLIGKRFCNHHSAVIAQAVHAIHPLALWYTARIWVEPTLSLLLALVTHTLYVMLSSPTLLRATALGVSIGLSCLVKGTMLLFPFVVLIFLALQPDRSGVKFGVMAMIAALLVVAPWTMRNMQVSGRFIPVNTSLGLNLIEGNAVGEHWLSSSTSQSLTEFWKLGKEQSDALLHPHNVRWESAEGDRILTREALRSYMENIPFFVWRQFANLCTFWYLTESPEKSIIFGALQVSLLLCAIASFVFATRSLKTAMAPLVCVCGYFILANASILGYGRFSAPVIPLLLLVAVALLDRKAVPGTNE